MIQRARRSLVADLGANWLAANHAASRFHPGIDECWGKPVGKSPAICAASLVPESHAASTQPPPSQSPHKPMRRSASHARLGVWPRALAYRQRCETLAIGGGRAVPRRCENTADKAVVTQPASASRCVRDQSGLACRTQASGPVRPGLALLRAAQASASSSSPRRQS